MDAGYRSNRKFPSYTTDDLKCAVVDYQMGISADRYMTIETVNAMIAEVKAREAGKSVHFSVPQIEGGKAINRIGRM